MNQSTGPLWPPSEKLGCSQFQLPPYIDNDRPGLLYPVLVWISITQAVLIPYCAGSEPVRTAVEPARSDCNAWPKNDNPWGNCPPSMRYCTLAISPRI